MTLPALSAVQDAYTAIDKIWADAEAQNRVATPAEANEALQVLATTIGLEAEPDGEGGDPLISLALAVAGTLRDALTGGLQAEDPASEYERILRSAEQEAVRNPEAGRALARIADRWLSSEFAAARKRNADKPKGTTHVGSPAPRITLSEEQAALDHALGELRALGVGDAGVASYVHHAAILATSGATELQILAAARIISRGHAAADDLTVLTGKQFR